MKKLLTQFLSDKENRLVQFIKYGLCGGIATVVDMAIFFLFAWLVFPAMTESDPFAKLIVWIGGNIEAVSETVRVRNYWIDKIICFLFSNYAAYLLNVLFVFKAGKHKRSHEMALFYAVSTVAFVLGTLAGDMLIRFAGLATTYSYACAAIAAILINYAGRKFFIFKG